LTNKDAANVIINSETPSLMLDMDEDYVEKIHNFYNELLVNEELLAG
jgi:hypothetical protein